MFGTYAAASRDGDLNGVPPGVAELLEIERFVRWGQLSAGRGLACTAGTGTRVTGTRFRLGSTPGSAFNTTVDVQGVGVHRYGNRSVDWIV